MKVESKETQILAYPIPVRTASKKATKENATKLRNTLKLARVMANYYLKGLYNNEILELVSNSRKKSYKELEGLVPSRQAKVPSRINRGILEIVGRTLRSIQARKALYEALQCLGNDPEKWNYRRLIEEKGIFAKSQQVNNLAEQTQNYIKEYAWQFRLNDLGKSLIEKIANANDPVSQYIKEKFPEELLIQYQKDGKLTEQLQEYLVREMNKIIRDSEFYNQQRFANVRLRQETQKLSQSLEKDIQRLNRFVLEDAYPNEIATSKWTVPDYFELQCCPEIKRDMISYAPDDGQALRIKEKAGGIEVQFKVLIDSDKDSELDWQWITVLIPLPEFIQGKKHVAPDLRYVCIHGKYMPVLDYKIEVKCEPYTQTGNFITVDWGIRKLVTVCVFNREGQQISPPIFLKFEPLLKKLLRIRKQIDALKAKRARSPHNSPKWRKYNKAIAQRWRKYRAIDKALAHLAANVIVFIGKIYNCSDIYVEWLKGLKSKKASRQLNWVINSTVRQMIYDLIAYKAKIIGIKLKKAIPPGYTSQYCPRCGAKGYHAPSSNRKNEKVKNGSWFFCPCCSFNADRDYVACCNLARKALYGNSLKENKSNVVAYKATSISDLLSRQSSLPFGKRLFYNLKGWIKTTGKKKDQNKYSDIHEKSGNFSKRRHKYQKRFTVFLSHYYLLSRSLR